MGEPFKGRFVKFTVRPPARGGLLENPTVRHLGGREFVVGPLADRGVDDPRAGMTYWFPVSDIQMIFEFDSIEKAKAYFEEAERRSDGESKS